MGDEKLLFRGGVFTEVTLEGPVVCVRELMVEQQFFVVASVIAKFTLEPATKHPQVSHCNEVNIASTEQNHQQHKLLK